MQFTRSLWLTTVASICFAQGPIPKFGVIPVSSGAAVTPALISLTGAPSSQTNAMGNHVAGSSTCSNFAYCAQLADPSVSGGTIVVFYTYKFTSAVVPTVTDDKGGGSSTYTCVTEAHDGATNQSYAGACYSINVAASIRNITVTWGTSAV